VNIELADTRVVSDPDELERLIKSFSKLKWLVHMVNLGQGPQYNIYAMARPIVRGNIISIPGRLDEVLREVKGQVEDPPSWFTAVSGMQVDEIALIAGRSKLMYGSFIPAEFKPVSIRVLMDGSEKRALIIPVVANGKGNVLAPLGNGSYRLDFELGEPRAVEPEGDEKPQHNRASLITRW
jgi:hypothetical protein